MSDLQFNEVIDRAVRGMCDIRPEWGLKCVAETNFYLEQFSGRNCCFKELTVLLDRMNKMGEVVLTDIDVLKNSFVKKRDHFYFR